MPCRDATPGWCLGGSLGQLWMNSWRAGIGFGLIWEATGCAGGTRGVIAGRI